MLLVKYLSFMRQLGIIASLLRVDEEFGERFIIVCGSSTISSVRFVPMTTISYSN